MQTEDRANRLCANSREGHLSENKRYHFLPTDDRLLLGATSFEELQSARRAIAEEASYPLRAVARRAKSLGVWRKLRQEGVAIRSSELLAQSDKSQEREGQRPHKR